MKYLDVVTDEHLSLNEHIKMITNKANFVMSFLQRNIGSCTEMVKEACFRSMVRPILEFLSSSLQRKILLWLSQFRVQRRAARFVASSYDQTSSVTSVLLRLNWPSLKQCRDIANVTMLYKICTTWWQFHLINTEYLFLPLQEVTQNNSSKLQHMWMFTFTHSSY